MLKIDYTDQLFLEFANLVIKGSIVIQYEDLTPLSNFHSLLSKGQSFTHSQSQFMLRLLTKYKSKILDANLDTGLLDNPVWSQPFRIIDTTKKIYVEQNDGCTFICVKQPFSFKDSFEKHCVKENADWRDAAWHPDEKVRKYTLNAVNPILVKDFADQKKYEMSQDFLDLVETVEQVYEDQEKYLPYSSVVDNKIELFNYASSAKIYFDSHKTEDIVNDAFLAKSLGYPCNNLDKNILGKICSTNTNFFHIGDLQKFVDLCFSVKGQVFILTKEKYKTWINNFLKIVDQRGYSKSSIKIGFRAHSNEDSEFNEWIRDEGLGGDLSNGKVVIFKDKVPKWLIEKNIDVTIVATAGPFLPSSAVSQTWINQQSCVIFLGEIKPSPIKGQKIVEL